MPVPPVSSAADAIAKPKAFVGLDTETALIRDDCPLPALACLQVFVPGREPIILGRDDAPRVFFDLAKACLATRTTLVGHHVCYETGVLAIHEPALMPLMFTLYDAGLIEDTLLNEKLDDIARGRYDNKNKQRWHDLGDGRRPYGYSLAASMLVRCDVNLEKGEDTWRLRFGELASFPVSTWPQAAIDYANDDSVGAWLLRMQQEADETHAPADGQLGAAYVYADAPAQARAGFALMLCRARGIRTDPVATERLRLDLRARQSAVMDELIALKFVRPAKWRPKAKDWTDPSKDTKVIKARIVDRARELGVEPKLTDKDQISMDEEALEMLADPALEKLLEFSRVQKTLGYVDVLQHGFQHPIHSEPNTLVANGRISWGSDSPDGAKSAKTVNLTNLPSAPGVRECYVPHPGNVFFAVDFAQLELCTVAQCCLWEGFGSRLAELINSDVDMHSRLGSMFLETDEAGFLARKDDDDFIIAIRNLAKRANFGLWGGMGVPRFLSTVRDLTAPLAKNGIVLDEHLIKRLKNTWLEMLPEARDWFKRADRVSNGDGQILQWTSGRLRGGLGYADAANGPFSGLAADGAKDALYRVTRAMYAEPDSPAFGAWCTAFIHDEIVGEAPDARGHEVVHEVERIMRETMQLRTPDVQIKCSMALMRRWRKGAKAYWRDGRLQPWESSPKFLEKVAKGEVFA